ncbi:enoyl-CoA hydratase-related protein [Halobacillus sp. ACCC02827]|uniref:enoyl-CoA hydratase-related protein n=1 Tax=unclassified Halobacillus TaxID=2636472 RepID=UPI0002A5107F|nr:MULTISPECIES: enoyl-CoA hydratase-related protein [unclassified Halobacillus]ELK45552.1 enoyl-CoA hydratase [Halobacillus sp. BAB-2008]WJE17590.1 enoyl-CoA hydratase-related protein [Halobacillus sp. ACCC02827]
MDTFTKLEALDTHVYLLTLNRPSSANALSSGLLDELEETLKDIQRRPEIRVLLITGSGNKAFSAGADLKERAEMGEKEVLAAVEKIGSTFRLLETLSIPTIAVMNGAAYGGGLELALACDIRFMSSSAKAGLTETSLAIIPGAGGTQRLPRLIGPGKAKAMIYSAKPVEADKAQAIGLVEYVYEPQFLLSEAKDFACAIARNAPTALKQAKKAIQEGLDADLEAGLKIEHSCYEVTIPTKDRLEGLNAFKEKRKPDYKGE